MKSRIIIGAISTLLFSRQIITINQLPFQYPCTSSTRKNINQENPTGYKFDKNIWILSLKSLNIFQRQIPEYEQNDLVLCQNAVGQKVFKIVGAVNRSYSPFSNGISSYIPPGFLFLIDPIKKQLGMENIAVVQSKRHYSLGKWSGWVGLRERIGREEGEMDSKGSFKKEKGLNDINGQSFERQILQRNMVRQQLKIKQQESQLRGINGEES